MALPLHKKMYISTSCYVSCLLRLAGYSHLRGGKLGLGGAQGIFSFKRGNNNEVQFQWRKAYTSYSIASGYVTSQRCCALSNGEMRPPFFAMKYETKKFAAARKRKVTAVDEALVEGKQEESLEASVNLEEPNEKPSKSRRTKSKVSLIDHGKMSFKFLDIQDLLQESSVVEEPVVGICTKSKRSIKKHDVINPDEESLEASVNLEEPPEKPSKSRRTKSKESLEASVNLEEPPEKPSKSRRTKSKDLLQESSVVEEPVVGVCSKSKRSIKKHDVINPDEESLEASVNLDEPPEKPSKSKRTKNKVSLIDCGKDLLQESSVFQERVVGICSTSKRSIKKHDVINPDEELLEVSVYLEEPPEKPSKSRRTKSKVSLIDCSKDLLQESSVVEEPVVGICSKSKRSIKKHDVINPDEESLEASVNLDKPPEKPSKSRRTKSKVSLIDCGKDLLQESSVFEEPVVGICSKSKRSIKKHDVINPDEELLEASVNLEELPEKPYKSRRTKSKDLLQESSLVEEPVGICSKSKRSRKKHDGINPDEELLEISSLSLEHLQKPSKSRRTRIKVDLIEPNKDLLQDRSLLEKPLGKGTKSEKTRRKLDVTDSHEELLEKSSKSRKIKSKFSLTCPSKDLLPNSSLIEEPLEKALKSKKARKKLDAKDSKKLLEASFALEESLQNQSKMKGTRSKVGLLDPNEVYQLEFDGASKGNPGIAGAGALLRNQDGLVICELQEGLGSATCNFAEYRAIILGLKIALNKGIRKIHVRGDSKLVCMQIQGLWKTYSQNLIGLNEEAKKLKRKFKEFCISHIERKFNSEADALANGASDLQSGEIKKFDPSLSLEKLLEKPSSLRKTKNKAALTDPNKGFYLLQFDGACKGNPGKAGGGAVLRDQDGSVICKVKEGLGIATNNVAEYRAVIRGLKVALSNGVQRIHVQGDSKLVCMQIQDSWKTNSTNIVTLNLEAKELLREFEEVHISHIYREVNTEADALANAAINLRSGEWTSM